MSSALDMSLEDIIKSNRKSGSGNNNNSSRGRGRGGAGGPGPARRGQNHGPNRPSPYSQASQAKAPESAAWQHDMYSDQAASFPAGGGGRASSIETGTKLYISNLEYGVSVEDIKELFSEVGDLKRYTIHYDKSGRSKGTAEVVYSRRSDAVAAVKRYNSVQLDGKPMKIEIVGTNISAPAPYVAGGFRNAPGFPRGGQGRGSALGRLRGGSRGRGGRGSGRGRGRGGARDEKLSAEDLDADLEKYHAESMQIN